MKTFSSLQGGSLATWQTEKTNKKTENRFVLGALNSLYDSFMNPPSSANGDRRSVRTTLLAESAALPVGRCANQTDSRMNCSLL